MEEEGFLHPGKPPHQRDLPGRKGSFRASKENACHRENNPEEHQHIPEKLHEKERIKTERKKGGWEGGKEDVLQVPRE